MASDSLVCARSAHPVLLHCLQDIRHDWRLLQLVNKSMCAAFKEYAVQVQEYTAKREHRLRMRKHCEEMKAMCDAALEKIQMHSSGGSVLVLCSWAYGYQLLDTSDLDPCFRPVGGVPVLDMLESILLDAETGTEEETPVIEVD